MATEEIIPSGDEETTEEDTFQDDDTCSPFELKQYFQHNYKIHDETSLAFNEDYILSLAKDDALTCLAAGLSDGSVRLFDISSERGLYITAPSSNNLKDHISICGVRFLDETPNLLLVGTTNGLLRVLDLRTQSEVLYFKYSSLGKRSAKNILSFDRNTNSRVLCVGTECRDRSAYLVFYDLRQRRESNFYYLCHSDDVTTLKFHPQNPDVLCSGSVDGLVNIFNIKETKEVDALLTTINTESSVHKVNWHTNECSNDIISCITHTNDFKSYENDGDLIAKFQRVEITKAIKRKSEANCCLIDCHNASDGGIILLAGSQADDGETMRSVSLQNKNLLPFANFRGNKQIVRESILDKTSNVVITAGEKGIVTLWTPESWDLSIATNSMSNEEFALPSSDEESAEENQIEDEDNCTPFELEQYFKQKYQIQDETAVTLKKAYILSLAKDESMTRIAAGLSDGSVHLFDISSERGLSYSSNDCIAALPSDINNPLTICGVRFLDESSNLLLVGTINGLVRIFDLRTHREASRFEYTPESDAVANFAPKNIVCFDRNSNSRVLCVGTEQLYNNVYLLFYDLRERKQLGGYFNSHQDDVTAVRFHPQNPDLLCSGSTDGLINIFDLKETNEDDALLTTINTESSVHKVNWHKNVYDKDIISCITHTNDFKLYECDEGDLIAKFDRAQITETIKRKSTANCNLIDCHNTADGGIFLLTGSNLNKGEIMRSILVQNKQILPAADFQGNKQIVRESILDINSNVLITGGESGIVTLWAPQALNATNADSSKLKIKTKKNKKAPY